MLLHHLALLLPLGATAIAPAAGAPTASEDGAGTLWHGGTIRLGDGETATALLVREGRVVWAGSAAELPPEASSAARIDLDGAVVVPGLHDAHGHLASYGKTLEELSLAGVESYPALIERVAEQAARQAPGTWIVGRGWDQTLWAGGAFPHHAPLSAVVPDHPVLLERVDGHAALANARALSQAGLFMSVKHTRLPPVELEGGRMLVDGEGLPTGVLIDAAMELVARHVPEPDRATRRRRLARASRALLELGLVAMHDMGSPASTVELLRELEAAGELELRVFVYLSETPTASELEQLLLANGPGARVNVVGVKLMVDGALGSRGAALLADYADEPGNRGLAMWQAAAFEARIVELAQAGLQPATHAIGDRANRLVLDAYEAASSRVPKLRELRPRIEHAQVVAVSDQARFAALGVIASVQPTHATSDMRWAEERLGRARLSGAYAWRGLSAEPALLALGSDFPVESPAPLLGLYAARTRQDAAGQPADGWLPEQRLTGAEALAGFTRGAAHAVRREDDLGRLQPGYRADFVVLDIDPVTCETARLLGGTVLRTVIEGRTVYQRD